MSVRTDLADVTSAMEEWHFPARYDQDYLPDPDSPYWFPHRETMDPEQRKAAVLVRLREVMRHAYATSPFYRRKWLPSTATPKTSRPGRRSRQSRS
jgi:hypothetical protein